MQSTTDYIHCNYYPFSFIFLSFRIPSFYFFVEIPGERSDHVHEGVRHSLECNAGTAPFLAVNTVQIVVIRGRRAFVWGSVYLDSFGEEDKELK